MPVNKEFNESVGITGVIFTKIDSDARGGAVISLKTICGGAPIKFVGIGEKRKILIFFIQIELLHILGMGDVVGLVDEGSSCL